jgi:hypothetical protein
MSRENGRWDEVYVYLARDQKGKEWMIHDESVGVPLIHADRIAADSMLCRAREVAASAPEMTVCLVRFSTRTDLEVIPLK